MSADCGYERWDWKPLVKGSTKRAISVTSTDSDVDLARVVVLIEPYGSDTASITLDSNATGVTINTATAGAWDFDIGPIAAATTDALTPGFYTINMTLTDSGGNVLEQVKGSWQILPK